MKAIILFFLITLWCLGSALAQNQPYGRWQYEETNEYGRVMRYIYHFKPNGQFVFECMIRSDSKKFTSHIIVEGSWKQASVNVFDRTALASLSPLLREYYEIDELESLVRVEINLNKVVSSTAKYDDGKILVDEQDALAKAWGNASFKELIPYQESDNQMTILSASEGKFVKLVYKKAL